MLVHTVATIATSGLEVATLKDKNPYVEASTFRAGCALALNLSPLGTGDLDRRASVLLSQFIPTMEGSSVPVRFQEVSASACQAVVDFREYLGEKE